MQYDNVNLPHIAKQELSLCQEKHKMNIPLC